MNSGDKKVKNTGNFAPQGTKGSIATVLFCAFGVEYPRVVSIAAAVQPKPETRENAALPDKLAFSKSPSVANASAEVTPLSSSNVRNKYSIKICGTNAITLPAPPRIPSSNSEITASFCIFAVKKSENKEIKFSVKPFK